MARRQRRWGSLAGAAALAVAACAFTAQFQAVTVTAASSSATLWGIDSCDPAQEELPATEQAGMGTPQFMGRYLGSNRCGTAGLSAPEVSYLASNGVSILVIADPGGFDTSSRTAEWEQGAGEAGTAIQQSQALGAPPGAAIFRDVELSDGITAWYIEGWFQAFVDSGSGYVPGFYENSWNTGFPFAGGAWCSAVAAVPAIAGDVALWSDEFQYGYGDGLPTRANAPVWDPSPSVGNPYPLTCANTTVGWQYLIRGGMPGGAPNVDVDEFLSAYSALLWGGGAYTPVATSDAYTPLTPFRICDTRQGMNTTCSGDSLGQGGTLSLFIAGVPGPQNQVVAAYARDVVLNITAIYPTANTFVTAYATGSDPPGTSNLNVSPGGVQANLVVVALGMGGQVSLFNSQGAVDVTVDVEGYFAAPTTSPTPGLFHSIPPLRICDTREGMGTACSKATVDNGLGQGQWRKVVVSGLPPGAAEGTPSLPADGTASAVALNLTGVLPTSFTYLSVVPPSAEDACPSGAPSFSNLDLFGVGALPNRVIVPLGPDQDVCVYNSLGSIDFIVDVNGWFGTGAESSQGAYFHSINTTRICDTRQATGTECSGSPIGSGKVLPVQVAGVDGIPVAGGGSPPVAVIANVTAVLPSQFTYLTLYPSDMSQPRASDVNAGAGTVTPNLTIVQLATTGSSAGDLDLFNDDGTTSAIVDVAGWFADN